MSEPLDLDALPADDEITTITWGRLRELFDAEAEVIRLRDEVVRTASRGLEISAQLSYVFSQDIANTEQAARAAMVQRLTEAEAEVERLRVMETLYIEQMQSDQASKDQLAAEAERKVQP